MTPRAHLVLDWNGTVVADLDRAVAATGAAAGGLAPRSAAEFRDRFRLPLHAFVADLGVPPAIIPSTVDRWNREMAGRPPTPAPGARRLLRYARAAGVAVHVVSSAAPTLVHRDADALGMAALIDTVTGDAHPKRDAVARYTRTGAVTVYVGDTEYDIEEGLAAGAVAVGTTYGYRPAGALLRAGARLVVADLERLIPIIGSLSST